MTLLVYVSPAMAAPAAPPYSLPFGLRPVGPVSVLRLDTVTAFFQDAQGRAGVTEVGLLLFSWKVRPWFSPLVRLGVVAHGPPSGPGSIAVGNGLLGGSFGWSLPKGFRAGLFFGLALPIGDAGAAAGVLARSAMDNAMFATNDLTLFPGLSLAWVGKGLTVQVEATVLQLFRVRGASVQPDEYKTNFTTGLHVGYFFIPQLSAAAELRYQRWLAPPAAVSADKSGTAIDNLSFALGVRGHVALEGGLWLRPGVSYAHGMDDPLVARGYHILQIDLPLIFP